jgi:hypothetical protein
MMQGAVPAMKDRDWVKPAVARAGSTPGRRRRRQQTARSALVFPRLRDLAGVRLRKAGFAPPPKMKFVDVDLHLGKAAKDYGSGLSFWVLEWEASEPRRRPKEPTSQTEEIRGVD